MKLFVFGLLIWMTFHSCSKSEITLPPSNSDTNLQNTTYIDGSVMKKMEGIYKVIDGDKSLGQEFVCKVSRYRVSFFSNLNGIFFILKYGYKPADGTIQFSGFWRFSENATQDNIYFEMAATDGATDLLNGIRTAIKMTGVFKNGQSNNVTLKFDRAFSTFTTNNEFMIFAHHGVQTTSNPPYAENSLDGVLNDEDYGVNGLEFDIRLTKDNVPICIHDPTINARLTRKGPLSGSWNQYGYEFLHEYIRLIDGQRLTSLEHALKAFVDSTTLKYFWMDIKGDPNVFRALEPIVRDAYSRAAQQGRQVVIFAGMPSEDVIDDFKATPTYATLPTLCEQSVDLAIENNSKYFGPRFSEGLLLDDVNRAHSAGIKVISWTLNDKHLIIDYLKNGKFDGFITDYPAYVVYNYYTTF
jgi:glycerophosphoryl diester phosphodiesterase